jgi:hypothetical protein
MRWIEIGFAAHDGGYAGGIVAAGVAVIGESGGHQQGAEVCIAESQRAVVMRVAHDHFCRISGIVDQNFLRGDQHVYRMTVGFDIEGAVRGELQEIQAGEVAG